jgi:hypothetical protein
MDPTAPDQHDTVLTFDEPAELDPWTEGHAPPADRAVGLELELIDLVAKRDHVWGHERVEIDQEIGEVIDELARIGGSDDVAA